MNTTPRSWMFPGFKIADSHYERRRGWRGWIDLLLRRKPLRVIDRMEIL